MHLAKSLGIYLNTTDFCRKTSCKCNGFKLEHILLLFVYFNSLRNICESSLWKLKFCFGFKKVHTSFTFSELLEQFKKRHWEIPFENANTCKYNLKHGMGTSSRRKNKYFSTITHFVCPILWRKAIGRGSEWGCEEMAIVIRNITHHS